MTFWYWYFSSSFPRMDSRYSRLRRGMYFSLI